MKTLFIITLVCFASSGMAAEKIAARNLKLGHWVVTVDQSGIMSQALAGLEGTENEKAEAREMMEKFAPKSRSFDQCVTPETFSDKEKMLDSTNTQDLGDDCEIDLLENTREKLVVLTQCPESQVVMKSTTHFISSKHYEMTIDSNMAGHSSEMKSIAHWKSAVCPTAKISTSEKGLGNSFLGRKVKDLAQRQKQRTVGRAEQKVNNKADSETDKAINKAAKKIFRKLFD